MNDRRRQSAFTLLELLLVLTIVGIITASVVVGFAGASESRRVRAEAERLALAVELARGEALRRNEMWGLALVENGYGFKRYSQESGAWEALARRPFAAWTADRITFAVQEQRADEDRNGRRRPSRPNERRRPADDEEREHLPAVAILPGGEVTPFDILVSADDAPVWVARSDGIGRVRAMRQEEAKRRITSFVWQP